MPSPTQDHCQSCQHCVEEPQIPQLLERISELEDENVNLRKLEEIIQNNTHLFEALLRASHEAILLLTPELTILRLIHSNLGYSEKDVLGQSLLTFVHPDDSHGVEQACASLISGSSKTCVLECRARGSNGAWVWEEFQMTDMLDDPCVQALVFNIRRVSRPAEQA